MDNREMDNKDYLDGIVKELMEDTDWELPPELRVFLVVELEWGLMGV